MPHLPATNPFRLNLAVRRALFAGLLAASPLLLATAAQAQPATSQQARIYAIPAGPLDQISTASPAKRASCSRPMLSSPPASAARD